MTKKSQEKKPNHLLRQAREQRGWSQERLAQELEVSSQTVSRWECGTAFPYPHFREQLCLLFGKNIEALGLLQPDLLDSRERALEDGGSPPISNLPAETLKGVEKLPALHVNDIGQQAGQPLAVDVPSDHQARIAALQLQNRTRMLGRLRHSYSELLDYSLQKVVRIELGLAGMPDAVQNATNRLVRLSQQYAQALPPGTSILEVYEMSERELLILGEPGAGKSTLLLQLAQMLVQQAEQVDTHPIPVMLRLSSWAEQKPAMEDWISEQLSLTYDVSQKLSTQWVRNEQILPLLDGLDEMDAASRTVCIASINAYHREHLLVPLVICSRRTEYQDAASQQKLALQHAVLIQPLTLEQVYASLGHVGQPLDILRQSLQMNQALQELTTTPLMLSILMLTYSRIPMPALSHDLSTLQRQLWTDYVAHMIELKGDSRQFSLQQTCSWLSWLARNLQKHYQTVFYLERVQPDWLPENLRQRALWLTMRLPLFIIAIVSSCIIGLFLQTVVDLTTGIQSAVLGCLLAGCLSQPTSPGIEVGSFNRTPLKSVRGSLGSGLISAGAGLIIGLSFGFELGPGYGFGDWLRDGLIYGTIIGLTCWVLLILLPRLSPQSSSPRALQTSAYLRHMFSTLHLRRMLLGATGLGLAYGLSTGLSYGWIYGPCTGLNIMLSYGCVIFLISFLFEKNGRDISLTERLRWSGRSFFYSLRSFKHCIASAVMGMAILLIVGLSYGLATGLGLPLSTNLGFRLSYGLSDGLSTGPGSGLVNGLTNGLMMGLIVGVGIGLAYWLALGLFQSIAQEQIEDHDRQRLNQGVRRSALNSTIIGLLCAVAVGTLGFFGNWLSYLLNEGLSQGLTAGSGEGLIYALSSAWLFAIGGGLTGWAISGGWAVLRHFVLRWLLHRRHVFPWHARAFLNDATARILLQRVGGGYSFIHRLLLEYFANLDDGNIPETNVRELERDSLLR